MDNALEADDSKESGAEAGQTRQRQHCEPQQ